MKFALGVAWLLLALSQTASAIEAPVLAQQPTLSATQIVFVFAGDLWSVPRQGGEHGG